jgi:hypothetical protein
MASLKSARHVYEGQGKRVLIEGFRAGFRAVSRGFWGVFGGFWCF